MGKPYEITYEYMPEYLFVIVSGDTDNFEISLQYWKEIAEECVKRGYRKVLVEERITGLSSEEDSYEVGKALAEFFPENVLVAFVDSQLEHRSINEVCEIVVRNRGFKGRIFGTLEEAHEWLIQNEPEQSEITEKKFSH
ncbi:MAG: hypothetical protein N2Z23_00760 [Pyrinomonadaceae bacterium]|nr:hypothetical protein [Pyrinomonadaceae bacterium]MCX7638964.1 hypothetical protein [Pyrinomonadaceae bacterium]MDW8304899.1 hypothetical protein [Acidobacteriota bacterium]